MQVFIGQFEFDIVIPANFLQRIAQCCITKNHLLAMPPLCIEFGSRLLDQLLLVSLKNTALLGLEFDLLADLSIFHAHQALCHFHFNSGFFRISPEVECGTQNGRTHSVRLNHERTPGVRCYFEVSLTGEGNLSFAISNIKAQVRILIEINNRGIGKGDFQLFSRTGSEGQGRRALPTVDQPERTNGY